MTTPVLDPALDAIPQAVLAAPRPTISKRRCRVCGRNGLFTYLDLGKQPLANDFRPADDPRPRTRAPLTLLACPHCRLSQLSYVVPKETLYAGTYAFSSGVSAGWHAHCDALAHDYARPGALVIDIAANDGTLLQKFAAQGCTTLGVEPSTSFVECAYPKLTAFWTSALVETQDLTGRAALIVAQNVLGHVDDVQDFMHGIERALAPEGRVLIEVPSVLQLLQRTAFDTVYHEHLSYWSVTALKLLGSLHGLTLLDVHALAVHGGSVRAVFARSGKPSDAVTHALVTELHELTRTAYLSFSARVTRTIARINDELLACVPYVGFGAAAKCTVLLNTLDRRAYPEVVYDETPAKAGTIVPGTRVPVTPPPNWARETRPLALFPWNWASTAIPKLRTAGYAGHIFVPLPVPLWNRVSVATKNRTR